jgi:hypothetical protein
LSKYRKEAIAGRLGSGIEEDWTADEEAYQGIDDANRGASGKPTSPDSGFTTVKRSKSSRSTVFLNITRPYVDAAAARVADMLLPNDETNWDIRPTPIPEGRFKKLAVPMPSSSVAQVAGMPPQDGLTGQPNQVTSQPIAPLQQLKDQARESAKVAKAQIEDWLVQCQWHSEVRKAIEDCARLGTGILKGPIPVRQYSRSSSNEGGMISLTVEQTIEPQTRRVDPWNFFPDPSCGENIHDGSYVWELDSLTAKQLRELKGLPGYLDDQIDKALELGPGTSDKPSKGDFSKAARINDADKFDVWYFHGLADREDLEAAGVEIPLTGDVSVPATVTMVNDVVIRSALNPLDSGEFPYDMMPWQRKSDVPWGMGVSRQINTPQRMLNAGTRNMMDNAAFTAGPQLVIRKGAVEPADGKWEITPRKIWWVANGADVNSAKEAFIAVNIPTQQEQLSNIIQFALKMAEDVTGLPMLMQGSQGTAPDTVGGMTIVNNNANVVLRRIIRTFDDKITEPHIRRYYEYLMMYGDDESAKGDFQIDARGSTALIERDFQNNEAAQILQMSLNPAFEISPSKAMAEYLKSRRFDSKRFELSDEEKAKRGQQPPPPMPQVEVAKIRAETDMKIAEARGQVELKKVQVQAEADLHQTDTSNERDAVKVQAEVENNRILAESKQRELEVKYRIALLDYANREKLSLDQVKADLAKESAKINLQRELAHLDSHTKQVLKPPVEPMGRAPNGRAYQA